MGILAPIAFGFVALTASGVAGKQGTPLQSSNSHWPTAYHWAPSVSGLLAQGASIRQDRYETRGQGTERILFPGGTTGIEFSDRLLPMESRRYTLRATDGQQLTFNVIGGDGEVTYSIIAPSGAYLAKGSRAVDVFRKVIESSGDYTIEVSNLGVEIASFEISLSII